MQQNRFQAFSDSEEDHSEEEKSTQKSNRPVDHRSRAEKRGDKKKKENEQSNLDIPKETNEVQAKKQKTDRERAKPKGVSEEPHPLDKHSGSGLRTHDRKGGAGQRNWGTYKDEVKEASGQETVLDTKEKQEEEEQQQQNEQEEEQMTLEEYFAKFGFNKPSSTKKQTKGNQDYSEFVKEGCQVISKEPEVDDKNPTKKKNVKNQYIGMSTENSELLGLRTGLKTFALREEKREEKKEYKPNQQKEQQQEVQPEQAQEVVAEDITKKPAKARHVPKNSAREDGGEVRRDNYRKGHVSKKNASKTSVGVNLEDDSLFPKLG